MRRSDTTDPRGVATREALIAAGLELFGALGYHAASSRALAAAAGVNQALIGYHFGGKRGLYLAVFEHIAERVESRLGPAAHDLDQRLAGDEASREELLAAILELIDRLAEVFASQETGTWAMLIVREQQQPGEAFELIWKRWISGALGVLTRAVAALRGRPPDDLQIRLLVLTFIGQTLVFRVARAAALRHLGWDDVGERELAAIRRRIHRNVTSLLTGEKPS